MSFPGSSCHWYVAFCEEGSMENLEVGLIIDGPIACSRTENSLLMKVHGMKLLALNA